MPTEKVHNLSALNGKRVLIVEDEAIIALTLECEVADAGATVVGPAFDLAGALRLAAQPLDAAVLDVNLKGEKIFAAARVLRDRGVPFVFASANCDEIDSHGGEFASYPRLEKPIAMASLLEALGKMVRKFKR